MSKQSLIKVLETQVSDLEQYTHINDVIISGLKIKHVCMHMQCRWGRERSVSTKTVLQGKNIHVDRNKIVACHVLIDMGVEYIK